MKPSESLHYNEVPSWLSRQLVRTHVWRCLWSIWFRFSNRARIRKNKLDILTGRIYESVVANDSGLGAKHALLNPYLNERQRRLVAAADARFLGHGGIATLARATGLSRTTLHKAIRELEGHEIPPERVRKAGGGRKSKAEQDPRLVKELERLVDPATRGDPCRRYAGRPKVRRSWPKSCAAKGTQSAPVRLRTFCSTKTTVCRRTGKRGRGPAIRIEMRSFNISMRRHRRFSKEGRR